MDPNVNVDSRCLLIITEYFLGYTTEDYNLDKPGVVQFLLAQLLFCVF